MPEPWRQTGLLAAIAHNAAFDGPRKKPSDFIPATTIPEPQSAAEGIAKMEALAARFAANNPRDEVL